MLRYVLGHKTVCETNPPVHRTKPCNVHRYNVNVDKAVDSFIFVAQIPSFEVPNHAGGRQVCPLSCTYVSNRPYLESAFFQMCMILPLFLVSFERK